MRGLERVLTMGMAGSWEPLMFRISKNDLYRGFWLAQAGFLGFVVSFCGSTYVFSTGFVLYQEFRAVTIAAHVDHDWFWTSYL